MDELIVFFHGEFCFICITDFPDEDRRDHHRIPSFIIHLQSRRFCGMYFGRYEICHEKRIDPDKCWSIFHASIFTEEEKEDRCIRTDDTKSEKHEEGDTEKYSSENISFNYEEKNTRSNDEKEEGEHEISRESEYFFHRES